jgi:endonuclease YncB( thermonuclease family)
MRIRDWAFVVVAAAQVAASPTAAEELPGPVEAAVVRVVDGDTIEFSAQIWIGLSLTASVRIRGIDTPEMRGECPEEKALAAAARDLLAELAGPSIRLTHIADDKYAGRVLANVASADGADLAIGMIVRGYARPYDGGARGSWCPVM